MEDDLISSLTRQVKEEVIENYLTERRIIELQVDDLNQRAASVKSLAADTGRRISRISMLTIRDEMRRELSRILEIPETSFWSGFMGKELPRKVRFIRVKAFTSKSRYRKLFLEAYSRLYEWMEKYGGAYEDLKAETQAVNTNIQSFHKNFDLLNIINFIKGLDSYAMELKHYLGENFTAQELASVDQKLYIHPVSFERLDVPPPLDLPRPDLVESALEDLSSLVYELNQDRARKLMQ